MTSSLHEWEWDSPAVSCCYLQQATALTNCCMQKIMISPKSKKANQKKALPTFRNDQVQVGRSKLQMCEKKNSPNFLKKNLRKIAREKKKTLKQSQGGYHADHSEPPRVLSLSSESSAEDLPGDEGK